MVDSKSKMPTTRFTQILARLKTATKVDTDKDFAGFLGVDPQAITNAKKRGEVPPIWLVKVSEKQKVSMDWLLYGTGRMYREIEEGMSKSGYRTEDAGSGLTCGNLSRQHDPAQEDTEAALEAKVTNLGAAMAEAQGFKISEALAMTARVLESGTTYAIALYLNIVHFDRAVQAEFKVRELEEKIKTMENRFARMEKRLAGLEAIAPKKDGGNGPPPVSQNCA